MRSRLDEMAFRYRRHHGDSSRHCRMDSPVVAPVSDQSAQLLNDQVKFLRSEVLADEHSPPGVEEEFVLHLGDDLLLQVSVEELLIVQGLEALLDVRQTVLPSEGRQIADVAGST